MLFRFVSLFGFLPLAFLVLPDVRCFAQGQEFGFQKVPIEVNGIPFTQFISIIQDQEGFLWLSTGQELLKYELSDKLYLSRSQVHRKIKALTGMSTAIFIRSIQLQEAKKLSASTPSLSPTLPIKLASNLQSIFLKYSNRPLAKALVITVNSWLLFNCNNTERLCNNTERKETALDLTLPI